MRSFPFRYDVRAQGDWAEFEQRARLSRRAVRSLGPDSPRSPVRDLRFEYGAFADFAIAQRG